MPPQLRAGAPRWAPRRTGAHRYCARCRCARGGPGASLALPLRPRVAASYAARHTGDGAKAVVEAALQAAVDGVLAAHALPASHLVATLRWQSDRRTRPTFGYAFNPKTYRYEHSVTPAS